MGEHLRRWELVAHNVLQLFTLQLSTSNPSDNNDFETESASKEMRKLSPWLPLALRVGTCTDRVEPRAVKRRPKHYPKLSEPRSQARKKLKARIAKRSGKKR